MSDYTVADVLEEGQWQKRACKACDHMKVVPVPGYLSVEVCNHPLSAGRYTTYQARYNRVTYHGEESCGASGRWFLDRAAMDRACK